MHRLFLRRVYLGLILFFLVVVPIFAQESTEEPVVPSDTPLPSPTFTELPTFTPTETPPELSTATLWPTETPTETATATLTETLWPSETATSYEFTPELTQTLSPEFTAELTAETTAELTEVLTTTGTSTATATSTQDAKLATPLIGIVYYDAMTVEYTPWGMNADLQFIQREGENWVATNSNGTIEGWPGTGSSLSIRSTFVLPAGTLSLGLRESSAGAYRLDLDSSGNLNLWRGTSLASNNIVGSLANLTHTVEFRVDNGQVTAELDGNLVLLFNDPSPLPAGSANLYLQATWS